jgi:hypothetical protein
VKLKSKSRLVSAHDPEAEMERCKVSKAKIQRLSFFSINSLFLRFILGGMFLIDDITPQHHNEVESIQCDSFYI